MPDLMNVFRYQDAMPWGADGCPTKPWRLAGWTWATNGRVIVAFPEKDFSGETTETPEKLRIAEPMLQQTPNSGVVVALDALRSFIGPEPALTRSRASTAAEKPRQCAARAAAMARSRGLLTTFESSVFH